MTCKYSHVLHDTGDTIQTATVVRVWCTRFHQTCQGCDHPVPFVELDRDGVLRLIAELYAQCIESARAGSAAQMDVAFDWVVASGVLDPHTAAHAILDATFQRSNPSRQQRRPTEHRRSPEERMATDRQRLYTDGNRCRVCGCLITNQAQTCRRHAKVTT